MKVIFQKGDTSKSVDVFIQDPSGNPFTGLVFNTSGLVCYYKRPGGSPTAVTLATLAAINSAWSSGGFKEADATNMPGMYRLDLPNAILATGVDTAVVMLSGAGIQPVPMEIQLGPILVQLADGVTHGGTAAILKMNYVEFISVTSGKAGLYVSGNNAPGLKVVGVGANGLYVSSNTTNAVYFDASSVSGGAGLVCGGGDGGIGISATASGFGSTGFVASAIKGMVVSSTSGSSGTGVLVTGTITVSGNTTFTGAILSTNAGNDIRGVKLAATGLALVTSWTVDITGNITGNLSGSVGSVTGAVGSVTGLTASDVAAIKVKTDNLPSDPADASDIAASFTTVNTTLATIAGYIDTEVAAIKAVTDALPTFVHTGGKLWVLDENGNPIRSLLADSDGVDGWTLQKFMRVGGSALAGKLSGAGTGTEVFRNAIADTKDRITATVDTNGNRTAIAIDAT